MELTPAFHVSLTSMRWTFLPSFPGCSANLLCLHSFPVRARQVVGGRGWERLSWGQGQQAVSGLPVQRACGPAWPAVGSFLPSEDRGPLPCMALESCYESEQGWGEGGDPACLACPSLSGDSGLQIADGLLPPAPLPSGVSEPFTGWKEVCEGRV